MASRFNRSVAAGLAALGLLACVCLPFGVARADAIPPATIGLAPAMANIATSSLYTNSPQLPPGAIEVREKAQANSLDDYEDEDETSIYSVADPLEPWNRFWFGFNDYAYTYALRPAYNAWVAVSHEDIRSGLSNFLHNLLFPMRFVNNLLQFRFMEAGVEFGRFVVNTTTTLGFSNVAKDLKPIVPVDPDGEDFGQTLGRWGIGHGIYLVWPIFGPSSLRDTVGRVGDYFCSPFTYGAPSWVLPHIEGLGDGWTWPLFGVNAKLNFNKMGGTLSTYESFKKAAVDPYVSMREAYINYRNNQVKR